MLGRDPLVLGNDDLTIGCDEVKTRHFASETVGHQRELDHVLGQPESVEVKEMRKDFLG